MEARCTGCGGRVMPYHSYIVHFKPTATCGSCGRTVRLRSFSRVVAGIVVVALLYVAFVQTVDSLALELTVGATLFLLGLIGDFWTYRNLAWEPERETSDASHSPGVSA